MAACDYSYSFMAQLDHSAGSLTLACAGAAPLALLPGNPIAHRLRLHAGSDDGANFALVRLQAPHVSSPCVSQAVPMLSHADLVVGQSHVSLPSNLETRLLSNAPATETLSDQQAAFNVQVSQRSPSWQARLY